MKFDPGSIYFVREKLQNNTMSQFIKIGLVKDPRTPEDRLSEHQTGNPNLLILESISGESGLHTDAVHYVEKQLHNLFSKHRVSGEWFILEEPELLSSAIRQAQDLASEISKKIPTVIAAAELDEILGDKKPHDQTEKLREIASSLAFADTYNKGLKKLVKEINSFYKSESNEDTAEEIAKFVNIIEIFPEARFDPNKFIAKQPASLIEQYSTHFTAVKSTFTLITAFKKNVGSDESYQKALADYGISIQEAKAAKDYSKLADIKEKLERDIKALEWQLVYTEAQLKVACGEALGIDGIVSWTRELEEKTEYDFGRLYAEKPEIYLDPDHFSQAKPSKRAVKVYRKAR